MESRSRREREASDHGSSYHDWGKARSRLAHVFSSPNTVYCRELFDSLLSKEVARRSVLEIGCGHGGYARKLSSFGARYVRAVDISETRIAGARRLEVPGKLEFVLGDVSTPFAGEFDVIVGRSVLHHLDYRTVLPRLYEQNLSRGGFMIFWEPLGSSWVLRLYHALSRSLHTPDERAFRRADIRYLRSEFCAFGMIPVNYFSLLLGIPSSFVARSPDNLVLRLADRADRALAKAIPPLAYRYRNAIFTFRKPLDSGQGLAGVAASERATSRRAASPWLD